MSDDRSEVGRSVELDVVEGVVVGGQDPIDTAAVRARRQVQVELVRYLIQKPV